MFKFLLIIGLAVYAPALLFAQRRPIDLLPRPYQCGFLREKQYFNLKRTVEPDELTWIVHLNEISDNSSTRVGMGVLIHEKYVLVPAHFFNENNDSSSYSIESSSCSIEEADCVIVRKFEILLHPMFDAENTDIISQENNIALLRFEKPVKFSQNVSPICLPMLSGDDMNYMGEHLTLAGSWFSGRKIKKKFVLIQSLPQCIRSWESANSKFVCANICDNGRMFIVGTPLLGARIKNSELDHYYLVALQTLGTDNGCIDLSPHIFLRIDQHVNWIADTIFVKEKN